MPIQKLCSPRGRPRPAGRGVGRTVREKTQDQDWAGHSSHRQSMATTLGAGSSGEKETQTDQSLPGKEVFSPAHTQTCLAESARPPRTGGRRSSPNSPPPAGPRSSGGPQTGLAQDTALGSALTLSPARLVAVPGSHGAPGGVIRYSGDSSGLPWASGPQALPVCGGPKVCSPSSAWAVLHWARSQCQE